MPKIAETPAATPKPIALGSQHWAKKQTFTYCCSVWHFCWTWSVEKMPYFIKRRLGFVRPHVVHKVWTTAHKLGYTPYFKMAQLNGPHYTDDHYLSIPSEDSQHRHHQLRPNAAHRISGHWHTANDNLDNIDPPP